MNGLEFAFKYRGVIAIAMFMCMLLNSIRFIGEWSNFWAVVSVQLFFGQGFYSYIANGTIRLAPGGIKIDHPKEARLIVGGVALLVYLVMFAFNGYDRVWGW